MPKAKTIKITYTNPSTVKLIMAHYGTGEGIQNTDNGLFIDGVIYPKGTVFEVGPGVLREFKKPCRADLMNQKIAGGMPMPYRGRYLALMKAANDFSKPSEYRARALMLSLEVCAASDAYMEKVAEQTEVAMGRLVKNTYDEIGAKFLVGHQVAPGVLSYTGDPDLLPPKDTPTGIVEINKLGEI